MPTTPKAEGAVAAQKPLEALIDEVHARGLRINNLFQIAAGWQSNLTDGHEFYEFGVGSTAAAALTEAIAKAHGSPRARETERSVSRP